MPDNNEHSSTPDFPLFSHNLEIIKDAIKAGDDVNRARKNGPTPLWWAIHQRRPLIVQALIEEGANVDALGQTKRNPPSTPLMRAIQEQDVGLCQILLDAGAAPHSRDLLKAVMLNQQTIALKLIAAGVDMEETEDNKDAHTALTQACSVQGDGSMALTLLAHGANPHTPNRKGHTPLMCASQAGNFELVKTLILNYQADVSAVSETKENALFLSAGVGAAAVCDFLLKNGGDENLDKIRGRHGQTVLLLASERGHTKICDQLLRHGAKPDVTKDGSTTALIQAVRGRREKLVRSLLSNGANAQGVQPWKPSPLEVAIHLEKNNEKMIELLLSFGADANAIVRLKKINSVSHRSLLGVAAHKGQTNICSQLLANGAEPSGRCNKKISTALMTASMKNDVALIDRLLKAGANLNDVDLSGDTALHFSTYHGKFDATKLLIEAGANPNAINNNGQTPLHQCGRATEINAHRICVYLLENGAKIDVAAPSIGTPLMGAAILGCTHVCRELLSWGADPFYETPGKESKNILERMNIIAFPETTALIQAARDQITLKKVAHGIDENEKKSPAPHRRRTL
jgi:ankyrin repeat protein